MGEEISTSVDQLMKIVSKYDKISFKEAAKELNVPVKTIQEWASMLEEEHLIQVIYSFTTPYIIHQTLSETDKKAKIKRFDQKKDNLSVKLDMTAKFFADLDSEMEEVSSVVEDVEKNMAGKLAHIGEDLKELENAEIEKEKLDKQIIETKQQSLKTVQELERHIQKSEQNFEHSFKKIKDEFEKDIKIISNNKSFVEKMHQQEKILQTKLAECDTLSQKIHTDFIKQTKTVDDAAQHMDILQKERKELIAQIENEHTKLGKILTKSKEFESHITDIQKNIYTKISQKTKELAEKQKGAKALPKNIKLLLAKKNKLKDIISDLANAQVTAKHDVERLRKEAVLLQKHVGMKDVNSELLKIHNDIDAMKKQKSFLTNKLKELYGVLSIKK